MLYGDGELSCYARPPTTGQILPDCPPQSVVLLRLASGSCCRVVRWEAGVTIVLPGQDTDRRSKSFRVEDPTALAEWQRVVNDAFGPSAVLPRWEPGQEWISGREDPDRGALELADNIIEVELRPNSNHWHRGTVVRFCDDGLRAVASLPALAPLRKGLLAGVVKAVGATPHLIAFDTWGELEIELERENNDKLKFRVATNPSIITPVTDASGLSRIDTIGEGPNFVGLRWRVQPEYSQASHQWEVQIRPHGSEWKPVAEGGCTVHMRSPSEHDSATASLFDLGSNSDKLCENREYPAEWRFVEETDRVRDTVPNTSADRQWECIIRGLPPSTVYDVRVRSFVCELEQEGRGSGWRRAVYGAWSHQIWSAQTIAHCPPTHRLLRPIAAGLWAPIVPGPADRQKWLITERATDVKVNKAELHTRWFRVRQPSDWEDGMEVLWRCQPHNEREVWQVTVSAERPLALTNERGKREIKTWQGSALELGLCGRVRAAAGEIIMVECKPPNGAPDSTMTYSYAAIRRKELAQREPVQGRYVYIRHATEALSAIDIQVTDATGTEITAYEAAMSSSHTKHSKDGNFQDRASPASNLIDGKITTLCTTKSLAATRREAWLRVDLGAEHRIGKIEVLLRAGQTLEGAVISVSTDRPGCLKTWESPAVPADSSSVLTYTWLASHAEPEPEPELEAEFQPEPLPKSELVAYTYPQADFRKLEGWLKDLAGVEELGDTATLLYSGASQWVDLDGDGVLMPFTDVGARAKSFRVKRQFTSKARPYWVRALHFPLSDSFPHANLKSPCAEQVELAEGAGGSGNALSLVMKYGDDLRQDQLALSMFALLNQIWCGAGVLHNTVTGVRVHVEAPVYRVATCGYTQGFVEMLPDSEPVDAIHVDPRRGANGWKQTNRILPSSVAGFMVIYFLDVRDRHQGNMVITGGDRFANIDFGWIAEGDKSGTFPIPVGLQYLLAYSDLWAEFHDLCWDALKVMYENFDRIELEWKRALRTLEFTDGKFFNDMPRDIKNRLSITRASLDDQLRKYDLDTARKNFKHWVGNLIKSKQGSGVPAEAAEMRKRLELRLSAQLELPVAALQSPPHGTGSGGGTGGDLTRTNTEALHSWLARLHLEKWYEGLVEQGCEHVIDLVSTLSEDSDALDTLFAEIGMPTIKANVLKAALKRDPRYSPPPSGGAKELGE